MSDPIKTWPKEIFLQAGDDDLAEYPQYREFEITWSEDHACNTNVRYVRADLSYPPLPQQGGEQIEEVALILWHRFAPDHHIEWADEPHKAEYRDAAAAINYAINPVWRGLSDSQWVNIVNHDRAYENYRTDDAVHLAVKMTEQRLKDNNSGAAVLPQVGAAPEKHFQTFDEAIQFVRDASLEIDANMNAAPAGLGEAKAVAPLYLIGDSGDVWKETTKDNYEIWIGRKRIMYAAPVAQALPINNFENEMLDEIGLELEGIDYIGSYAEAVRVLKRRIAKLEVSQVLPVAAEKEPQLLESITALRDRLKMCGEELAKSGDEALEAIAAHYTGISGEIDVVLQGKKA